jgi:hypothetical protein
MFEDVPNELVKRVLDMSDELNKSNKHAAVAWEVVDHYANVKLHESMFEKFQIHNVNATEPRLVEIGAWLFSLRNETILPELVARLQKKDNLRAAFFETSAAAFCKRLGYSVNRGPGIRKKGLDFDFAIKSDDSKVNVEVTELRAEGFDVKRVIDRLDDKRDQLPRDEANILCCYLPFTWGDDASFLQDLSEVTDGLFRSSKRINAVNFSMEQNVPATDNISIRYITHFNENPRNPDAKLNAALRDYYSKMSPVPTSGGSVSPSKEFDEWVNSLIP